MFRRFLLISFMLSLFCTTMASATTKTEMCASAGLYSDVLVTSRDSGIPPSQAMAIIDRSKHKHDKELINFLRWIVLTVYRYDSFDAARLRQLVETACFERM